MSALLRVAVLGGGITGLVAAYRLAAEAKKQGRSLECTVIEQASRWGGKVKSVRTDGLVFEEGPDSILTRKPAGVRLCLELGLGDRLVGTAGSGSFVRIGDTLHRLPEGLSGLVPTKLGPFVKSSLITARGKARMALEYFVPPRREAGDESLGSFVRRRLGTEALERLAEPLLSGIYAGNVDNLSVRATFPQFIKMEEEHGGMIRAVLAGRKKSGGAKGAPAGGAQASGSPANGSQSNGSRAGAAAQSDAQSQVPRSTFVSLEGGIYTLIEALVDRLASEPTVALLSGVGAASLRRVAAEGGDRGAYEVALEDGRVIEADAVLLTTPAYVQSELLKELAPAAANSLGEIGYVSVAGVVLEYRRSDIGHPLNGTGYLNPRTEGRPVTACTWASAKWPHVAPEDRAVLRFHFGKGGAEQAAFWEDDRLIRTAEDEARTILGIRGQPRERWIYRWNKGMPQYEVGHLERVERIERELAASAPGVFVAGAAFRGVGIPDCVTQGEKAAQAILSGI